MVIHSKLPSALFYFIRLGFPLASSQSSSSRILCAFSDQRHQCRVFIKMLQKERFGYAYALVLARKHSKWRRLLC